MMQWYVSHLRGELRPAAQRLVKDDRGCAVVVTDQHLSAEELLRRQAREHTTVHGCDLFGAIGGVPQPTRSFLVGEIRMQGGVFFYGTLGSADVEFGQISDHEHEFIVVSDSPQPDLVHLLATARLHHYAAEPLGDHHTFLLAEDSGFRAKGYTRALVARADLYPPFHGHNVATVAGKHVRLRALVLLTEEEFKVKAEQGVDALFDRLEGRSDRPARDLLSFR